MRGIRLFAAIAASAALATAPAFADSPHFTGGSASITNAGNLVVSFQEAGLGNFVTVDIHATADETDTWGCINHGNNHPQGLDSTTAPVSSPSTTFDVGHNGNVRGSVTITHQASAPPPGFSCPAANMTIVLVAISYTDIVVVDDTSQQSLNISGTFTKTFFK
jgi:hypothetical protein